MSKERISPKEYSDMMSSISLVRINLVKSNVWLKEQNISGHTIDLNVKMKLTSSQGKETASFLTSYKLTGSAKDGQAEVFSLSADFDIIYAKLKEIDLSKEFVDEFRNSIELISWPYFREYVQSMTARMGLPPLTLPNKFFVDE